MEPPPEADTNTTQPGPEEFKNFDIVRAVQYGVLDRVQELVDGGYDVNMMDKENVSLLHWAAINNRGDIVKYVDQAYYLIVMCFEFCCSRQHLKTL